MFKKIRQKQLHILTEEDLQKFIDVNTEIVVIAPWNGDNHQIPVTIRMLDQVSISSCGDFNTVTPIVKDDEVESFDLKEMVKVKNIHENIVRLALVHPTFEELETKMMGKDFYKQTKDAIIKIEGLIEQLDSEKEKEEYREELERLELSISFLLPFDFTTYIVTIELQQEATDLNKLTKDMLLQAGFLAEKYNKRPSEYLNGTFTDKQRIDIDVTALTLVSDYRQDQQVEKGSMHWIRGK